MVRNTGRGGIARAHYPPGCLLSRGGPVSPRRNRNLGMEQTGARVGPPFYLPISFFGLSSPGAGDSTYCLPEHTVHKHDLPPRVSVCCNTTSLTGPPPSWN